MAKYAYPVLCGGTFFTLLLEARQDRTGKKEQRNGQKDGLSEPDTLAGLVRVMYPEFKQPSDERTFRTNTSDYKACRDNGGNMPFFDKEIGVFDNRVMNDYQKALVMMCKFVNRFIEVGGSLEEDKDLVKALIDLIIKDQSVLETDEFYVLENGQPLTKESIRSLGTVCLPAFLLGVWHFAVVNRRDNTEGKDTFDAWCPPSDNRRPRVYIAKLGKGITRQITITMPEIDLSEDGSVDEGATADSGSGFDNRTGFYEECAEDFCDRTHERVKTQFIKNQIQIADKIANIQHVDTINM